MEGGRAEEGEVERLPVDLLAHIFVLLPSFVDLAQASGVCRKWREGALRSLARRECLSFAGYRMDDDSAARLVCHAYNLRDLDISRSCWGCQITDNGLYKISLAKCIGNLTSISLWGMAGITDKGVIQLVSKAKSLQHLNVGGTFITDESLLAIGNSCPHLRDKYSSHSVHTYKIDQNVLSVPDLILDLSCEDCDYVLKIIWARFRNYCHNIRSSFVSLNMQRRCPNNIGATHYGISTTTFVENLDKGKSGQTQLKLINHAANA